MPQRTGGREYVRRNMGGNWGCLRLGAKHVLELRDVPGISSTERSPQNITMFPIRIALFSESSEERRQELGIRLNKLLCSCRAGSSESGPILSKTADLVTPEDELGCSLMN